MLWVPLLRIGWIGDNGVEVERVVSVDRVLIVKERPIVFQGVVVAGDDVGGQDTAHDEVHTGEVIGVFLQLLSVILDVVRIHHVLGDALADIEQERAGAAGGVVNLDGFLVR